MDKAIINKRVRQYAECPSCHKSEFLIDEFHLARSDSWETEWSCSHCGRAILFSFQSGEVFVEPLNKWFLPVYVLLRQGNYLFLVKGHKHSDASIIPFPLSPEEDEQTRYFYEEHTCPTNITRDIEEVVDLETEQLDQHGIFEYIGSLPYVEIGRKSYGLAQEIVSYQEFMDNLRTNAPYLIEKIKRDMNESN